MFGGRKERRVKSAETFYRVIAQRLRSIDDLDVRCQNCNYLYNYQNGLWSGKSDTARWRSAAIEKLGAKCVNCGKTDVRILQINHIFGCGRSNNRNGNRRKMYVSIATGGKASQYDIRCANCNHLYIPRKP